MMCVVDTEKERIQRRLILTGIIELQIESFKQRAAEQLVGLPLKRRL